MKNIPLPPGLPRRPREEAVFAAAFVANLAPLLLHSSSKSDRAEALKAASAAVEALRLAENEWIEAQTKKETT